MAHTAHIRKLTIQRFRGIHSLTWLPAEGMNVILGGGDVGKTTILEAIALLLSPSNTAVLSEADYWARDNAQEFVIEAVMTLPDTTGIGSQSTFAWPWAWDGQNAASRYIAFGYGVPRNWSSRGRSCNPTKNWPIFRQPFAGVSARFE